MKSSSLLTLAAAVLFVLPSPWAASAQKPKRLSPEDLIAQAEKQNGLGETATAPWHVVAHFESFDEHGQHENAGTFEEWWFGPRSFKTVLKSEGLNQTDVATEQGLFRSGDQQWPDKQEAFAARLLSSPVAALHPDLKSSDLIDTMRGKGEVEMRCISFRPKMAADQHIGPVSGLDVNALPNACFAKDTVILRVAFAGSRSRRVTILDNFQSFEGQFVPRDIRVTEVPNTRYELHVLRLEALPATTAAPQPEQGSKGPLQGPVQLPDEQLQIASGLRDQLDAVMRAIPRDTESKVRLSVAVSAQGQVLDVAVVSGPPAFAAVVAKSVRKLRFKPFTILGTPVEADEMMDQTFGTTSFTVPGRR